MTLLGAVVYAGFFALAALWLLATNPDAAERDQSRRQDRSNPASAAAAPLGSSPCCASQSSQK